eukprot:6473655-Amphidinium_carterae.1
MQWSPMWGHQNNRTRSQVLPRGPPVGEDVLITGAGPIGCTAVLMWLPSRMKPVLLQCHQSLGGIMAAAICRHIGARHIIITDINDFRHSCTFASCSPTLYHISWSLHRLDLAMKCGATRALNVREGSQVMQRQQ